MKVKYTHIQFVNKDGWNKAKEVDKVFWLAVIPPECDHSKSQMFHGINIGISIPHHNKNDEKQFYDELFGKTVFKKKGFVEINLMGLDGENIPVIVGEANGYEEDMGTSCLFGYINPLVVAGDERLHYPHFGSIAKELSFRGDSTEGN